MGHLGPPLALLRGLGDGGILFVVAWLLSAGEPGGRGGRSATARWPRRRPACSPALYKTLAFGVSSFFAGVAGALLAIEVSFVNPDTFPLSLSILLLASAVVGGLGALSGVIFGALVLEFLPMYAQDPPLLPFDFSNQAPTVVFGAVLILIMFLLPGGVAGLLRKLADVFNGALQATNEGGRPTPASRQGGTNEKATSGWSGLSPAMAALSSASAATEIATARRARPRESQARSITIGGTFPLSGPASLYAPIPKGMKAYFNYVNPRKGPTASAASTAGKIVWKYYDDGYNPAQTVQLTNKLILQDKVFAIVGTLGTEHNQADPADC